MRITHLCKFTLGLLLALSLNASLSARELMIASGAGYKKPVMEVIQAFEAQTGIEVDAVFGNLQMVAGQAAQTDDISCIIGDRKFLKKLTERVTFAEYQEIGKGILVLAYRKGIELNQPEDMATDAVHTLFMPQDGKAIYGIAGTEALKAYGYDVLLTSKVTQVATVPQVVSYLLTGEADAGFINLTEALANSDKLGGYLVIPQDKYTGIAIVSGVVLGFQADPRTVEFLEFLKSPQAVEIFSKYGLK